MSAYDRLSARFARIATIGECAAVLGWDSAVIMPPGGAAARGEQLAVLAGMAHAALVASQTGDDLAAAEAILKAEPQVLVYWQQGEEGVNIPVYTLTTVPGLPDDANNLLRFGRNNAMLADVVDVGIVPTENQHGYKYIS